MKKSRVLLIDNFDSFTFNLYHYILACDFDCDVYRNKLPINELNLISYDALVLSPGPDLPKDAGNLMQFISEAVGRMPILGICLGHQALAEHFGGTLAKLTEPYHGKISICIQENGGGEIFHNLPAEFNVVRYHSWYVSEMPEDLVSFGTTQEGINMAFKHKDLPVYGIQFHPEAVCTEFGHQMIKNFVSSINQ